MELIGHRGARAVSPQNTLHSLKVALTERAPIIEFDVQLTKDSKVVLFHDKRLGKITGGAASGTVKNFTLEDIQKINVNDGFKDGKFYQIPTLEEALDLIGKNSSVGHRPKVNIELKGSDTAGPVAKIISTYLERGWKINDFIVSSFRHSELRKFKKLMPSIDVAVLVNGLQWLKVLRRSKKVVRIALGMNAVAVNPGASFVNRALVDLAHQAGLEVNVHTVNKVKHIKKMQSMGVDRIFTDDVGRAKKILGVTY